MGTSSDARPDGRLNYALWFQPALFYVAPSLVLLYYARLCMQKITRDQRLARPGLLLPLKLAVVAAIGIAHFRSLGVWQKPTSVVGILGHTIIALFSVSSTISIAVITYASHTYSLRPMASLAVYCGVTMLLDVLALSHAYLNYDIEALAPYLWALPVFKLALIVLEEFSKHGLIVSDTIRASLTSESLTGFYSRPPFQWANPFLLFSFCQRAESGNLPDIGSGYDSEQLYNSFKARWGGQTSQESKYALLRACFFSMPHTCIHAAIAKLLETGFVIGQQLVLHNMMQFLYQDLSSHNRPATSNQRIGHILATAIVFFGRVVMYPMLWLLSCHFSNYLALLFRCPSTGTTTPAAN